MLLVGPRHKSVRCIALCSLRDARAIAHCPGIETSGPCLCSPSRVRAPAQYVVWFCSKQVTNIVSSVFGQWQIWAGKSGEPVAVHPGHACRGVDLTYMNHWTCDDLRGSCSGMASCLLCFTACRTPRDNGRTSLREMISRESKIPGVYKYLNMLDLVGACGNWHCAEQDSERNLARAEVSNIHVQESRHAARFRDSKTRPFSCTSAAISKGERDARTLLRGQGREMTSGRSGTILEGTGRGIFSPAFEPRHTGGQISRGLLRMSGSCRGAPAENSARDRQRPVAEKARTAGDENGR